MLYDGESLNNNNNKITNFSFAKSDFRLGEIKSHFIVDRKLQEQSTGELLKCIKSIYIKIQKLLIVTSMHLEMYIRNYSKDLLYHFTYLY